MLRSGYTVRSHAHCVVWEQGSTLVGLEFWYYASMGWMYQEVKYKPMLMLPEITTKDRLEDY